MMYTGQEAWVGDIMLGRFVIKLLYIIILCYLVQNVQCADDPGYGTPAKIPAVTSADPTPGRRVLEEQAKHLKRENFTGLLDEATVDGWRVSWEVFANQELPFDHPDKRLNINKLLGKLKVLT